jgi:hypothetical protein
MFGFGKTIKEPLADAKTAERWLASFPANDPRNAWRRPGRARPARRARPTNAAARGDILRRVHHSLRKNLTAQYLEHGNQSHGWKTSYGRRCSI